MKRFSVLTIVCLLSACNNIDVERDKPVVISVDFDKIEKISFREFADSISYVELETNDSCLIMGIERLFITQQRIIVLNRATNNESSEVFVFDGKGKYLNTINNQGDPDGPKWISDISLDPKGTIHVWDGPNKMMYLVESSGRMTASHKLAFYADHFSLYQDSMYVFYKGEARGQEDSSNFFKIICTNLNGNILYKYLPFNITKGVPYTNNFTGRSIYPDNSDNVLISLWLCDSIFGLESKELTPLYRIDYGKYYRDNKKVISQLSAFEQHVASVKENYSNPYPWSPAYIIKGRDFLGFFTVLYPEAYWVYFNQKTGLSKVLKSFHHDNPEFEMPIPFYKQNASTFWCSIDAGFAATLKGKSGDARFDKMIERLVNYSNNPLLVAYHLK